MRHEPKGSPYKEYYCNECDGVLCWADYPFHPDRYPTCPRRKGMKYKFKKVNGK